MGPASCSDAPRCPLSWSSKTLQQGCDPLAAAICKAVLPLLSRLEPSRVPSVVVAPDSNSSCMELGH